jgi:hypothetical protein
LAGRGRVEGTDMERASGRRRVDGGVLVTREAAVGPK